MNAIKLCFILNVLFSFCLQSNAQVDENFWDNQKKAFAAKTQKECLMSLEFCNQALTHCPHSPVINYLSARLNAILGNNDTALIQLLKATELGYITKMRIFRFIPETHQLNDPAFNELRNDARFKTIIRALNTSESPIHKSEIAFIIKDLELEPEGITYDPIDSVFYLGSTKQNKIVRLDRKGIMTDFAVANQDSINMVLGIHVDSVRRHLWACSYKEDRKEIFKYDLNSATLIKKYSLIEDGERHHFNDLVIHRNGDIFITDPWGPAIYRIPSTSDELELFIQNKLLVGINGITLSANGKIIYAGTDTGIFIINIQTKSFSALAHEPVFTSCADDGLYFANNCLFAVQLGLNQVSRFYLNNKGTYIDGCEIIERNSPYLYNPTTGVIVGDYFYFIADSEAKAYKQEGVIIMKTPLKDE